MTNKKNITKFQYSIQNEKWIKRNIYTITSNVSWSEHIKIITITKQTLDWIFTSHAIFIIVHALYLSLVRPLLEYAANVWAPYWPWIIQTTLNWKQYKGGLPDLLWTVIIVSIVSHKILTGLYILLQNACRDQLIDKLIMMYYEIIHNITCATRSSICLFSIHQY